MADVDAYVKADLSPSPGRKALRREAVSIDMGRLGDLAGHRAIAQDQPRNHRFAKRTVVEHCRDEYAARHSDQYRVLDREGA